MLSRAGGSGVADRLRTVFSGEEEPRLRAVWRVLLAVTVLLVTGAVTRTVTAAAGLSGWVVVGVLQAAVFGLVLGAWARFVDRRRVRSYGLAISSRWVTDATAAFVAVVIAQSAWYGLGDTLGWTSVTVSAAAPSGSVVLSLAAALLGIGLNVLVQQTAYFGLVDKNAAEGVHARGVSAKRAVLVGWVVGALYVVAVHQGGFLRPGLYVAGGVFGLLYVHTGSLALPVGFHLGVNYTGGWVFVPAAFAVERAAVFTVAEGRPLFDALSGPAVPQILLGYLLVVGWLWLRGRLAGVDTGIAEWTPP